MTHVLAVRLDNDGDVLLAGPAVRALAAGADRLTLLCGPRGRSAAAMLPGVDDLLTWQAPWIDPEPGRVSRADVEALIARVVALGADRAFVLGSFHQSPLPTALVLRLAGVPWIGAVSIDYPGSLLDLRGRDPGDVHEVRRSLALVEQAGFRLAPGDAGALEVRRTGAASPLAGPYVVVHPGASVPARAWSPARNAQLVAALAATGRRVVVTGSTAEHELTAQVSGEAGLDLGGTTDLPGLAEVLAGADAVVVGNTGPAHLAAAVGTPVVSLFAPTVPPARWRPWAVPHELLFVEVPCAGCRARTCPVAGHPCLEGVTVGEVQAAVERLAAATSAQEVAA